MVYYVINHRIHESLVYEKPRIVVFFQLYMVYARFFMILITYGKMK